MNEGKIGGAALSDVNVDRIRAAAKITKVVAVEVDVSLFSTNPLSNRIAQGVFRLEYSYHGVSSITLPIAFTASTATAQLVAAY